MAALYAQGLAWGDMHKTVRRYAARMSSVRHLLQVTPSRLPIDKPVQIAVTIPFASDTLFPSGKPPAFTAPSNDLNSCPCIQLGALQRLTRLVHVHRTGPDAAANQPVHGRRL